MRAAVVVIAAVLAVAGCVAPAADDAREVGVMSVALVRATLGANAVAARLELTSEDGTRVVSEPLDAPVALLSIDAVVPGSYQLLLEILDGNGVVILCGHSAAEVVAGATARVSIALETGVVCEVSEAECQEDCADGDSCTVDVCVAGRCVNNPIAPGAGPDETCNGVDDDCDGDTDEDFALGSDCDPGDACMDGELVCDGPNGTTCLATAPKADASVPVDGSPIALSVPPSLDAGFCVAGPWGFAYQLLPANGLYLRRRITAGNGNVLVPEDAVWGFGAGEVRDFDGLAAGSFALHVGAQDGAAATGTMKIWALPAPASAAVTLDGTAAPVTTTVPGQDARWSFSIPSGTRVAVKLVTSSGACGPTAMAGPGGSIAGLSQFFCNQTFMDPASIEVGGSYTLAFDPNVLAPGTFTMRAWAVPPDDLATITVGGAAQLAVTTPGQGAAVRFGGVEGQSVTSDVTLDGGDLDCFYARVVDPDGIVVASPFGCGHVSEQRVLTKGGVWTIAIDLVGDGVAGITARVLSP